MIDFTYGLKIGDIISAYHAGYHQIIKVERRFVTKADLNYISDTERKLGSEYGALITYKKLYNENGTIAKTQKQNSCDASFCRLASTHIDDEIDELLAKIINLRNIKEVIK